MGVAVVKEDIGVATGAMRTSFKVPLRRLLRAIEILLRKSIPDLAAAEFRSEQTYRYVVELPPVLSRDEWQRKYGQNPRLDMGGDRAAEEPAIA